MLCDKRDKFKRESNSVIDTELQRSEVRRDESISVLEGSGKRWIDGSTSASWKGQKSHGA